MSGYIGVTRLRNKNWKKTTYTDRVEDIIPHDLIVDELSKYPKSQKAEPDNDYSGVDIWIEGISFDVKVTDGGIPKTYKRRFKGFELFQWLLENQDLDRFHDTNRITIVLYDQKNQFKKTDAETIARYIDSLSIGDYYLNTDYALVGRPNQKSHIRYGERHKMNVGLLIHYKNNACKTYPIKTQPAKNHISEENSIKYYEPEMPNYKEE